MENTRLEKYKVCTSCFSIGITHGDCICTYSNKYDTIELEFEVCNCCNKVISDGSPAETEFNDKQIETLIDNHQERKRDVQDQWEDYRPEIS